jgi:hypothetical protein
MMGFFTSRATILTAWASPGEEQGKPASITKSFQLEGDFQLLLGVEFGPRYLLAVPQGGVENGYLPCCHDCLQK